jgi:hypothetical protein
MSTYSFFWTSFNLFEAAADTVFELFLLLAQCFVQFVQRIYQNAYY